MIANQTIVAKTLAETIADTTAYLKIPTNVEQKQALSELYAVFKQSSGNVPVVIYYEQTDDTRLLPEKNWVSNTEELQESLEKILGKGNVIFK
ncbi:DNA polymerase III alpha subunit [Tetragenococcus muriaticus PMC-11-5]|uniref:DNA polymerase III alpha subunit n=3 Tax=Tetragenococcus muriaticus TaxID=64642 RepID=A0A091C581_9ENTE|nr:hypothetical protein [Tetragenococcus muriaticus]KFN91830.1 DNA polymerase III alpha subunit [Tetragenococcus muriaticus 3MR10-3]KFN92500.1 DNA polymerase III alpha subunit [Tetragenococcus muriaticus PMC-11-5]